MQLRVILIAPAVSPVELTVVDPRVDRDPLLMMQALVGGNIELMIFSDLGQKQGLDFWGNEEGKIVGMPPNLNLGYHYIVGNIIVARHTEGGDTISVRDGDMQTVNEILNGPSLGGGNIVRVKTKWAGF